MQDDDRVDNLNRERPDGWKDGGLFPFIEEGWGNSLATFANKNILCRRLTEVDTLFMDIQSDLKVLRTTQLVPSLLFMRAFGAFRSTVAVSLAMPTDAFALMRSSLESAGYALYIYGDETLAEAWLRRDESKKTRQTVRDRVTQGLVKDAIKAVDVQLLGTYSTLYERAIDFGAHPNEKAVLTNLASASIRDASSIQYKLLGGDGPLLDGALRSSVQAGICVLRIFQYVFPERYASIDMTSRIHRVSQGF
ncbi:hypothetical protein SAMN05428969_3343 [Devosia sp. YR412]|uniref:hypothetical protein n=1 Tax=Devosia sp. YR412 TaxID=1881030 RepID=UPI0008CDF288|nr:hypothetical protein [Devosia sp. YR412]SEQ52089.1 hypothetical protein SAMN05428969_3343 [Devosia sp. YR412]